MVNNTDSEKSLANLPNTPFGFSFFSVSAALLLVWTSAMRCASAWETARRRCCSARRRSNSACAAALRVALSAVERLDISVYPYRRMNVSDVNADDWTLQGKRTHAFASALATFIASLALHEVFPEEFVVPVADVSVRLSRTFVGSSSSGTRRAL